MLGALDLILTRVVRGAIGHGSPALPSQSRYWPGTTRLLCSDGVLQAQAACFPAPAWRRRGTYCDARLLAHTVGVAATGTVLLFTG